MGKKKGAVAAKARAKREAKTVEDTPCGRAGAGGVVGGSIVHEDGSRVHRGLQNLGNTCYMNSIVQCLNVSYPFSDDLLRNAPPVSAGMCATLSSVFRGIRGIDDSQGTSFNPKPLQQQVVSRFPWFKGKEQQDAHEFLRTLLGSVSDEFEAQGKSSSSTGSPTEKDPVNCNFGGRYCAATLCWGCQRLSLRLDPFFDLQLHLPSLAGQQVGAMGLSAAALSGDPDPPPNEHADGEGSDSSGTGRRKKKKGGKKKDAAVPVATKVAAKPKLGGVWGAARDREETLENAKLYVFALLVKVLQKSGDIEPEVEEAQEEVTFEVELTRQNKTSHPSWGFRWSDTKCEDEVFVLVSIVEDSLLEKWNLKRRAMEEMEQAVCVGDRLIEVNGETDYKEMSKMLRTADKVTLQLAHGSAAAGADLGPSRDESDGETARKAQAVAAKEQRRKTYCSSADQVYETLAPELRQLFGPEGVHKDSIDRLPLERCLQHFSGVEALEDEYKPVYNCTKCSKDDKTRRTYASRRMWLCSGGLPALLTMQLKRFRRYRDKFEKSVASIALPLSLDLTDYVLEEEQLKRMKPHVEKGLEDVEARCCAPPPPENSDAAASSVRYELYGLCVHQGSSMKAGHYVAFVNGGPSLEKERWYGISDARTWKCNREEVLKAEGYVVFYRREGTGAAADAALAAAAVASAEAGEAAEGDEDGASDGEAE
mmetsp:Transcript_24639/g.82488  ORF Transcript_24639/g.82488 Transcript_24639/m.82488 type:complete len:707 (-) Transcript_24639:112-2232(-)